MRHAVITPRNRIYYVMTTAVVVALGLASRRFPGLFPSVLGKYPGDALWTIMVFAALGVLLPRMTTLRLATLALVISFAVEFSQLYQAPWINSIRGTFLGHLVLGSGFGWGDLLAYTVGAALGVCGELLARRT
jgi:hypothetical protein